MDRLPYEDLGGPTPENYKPDNDSAKLKEEPKVKTVKDVVNKGAKPADPMKGMLRKKRKSIPKKSWKRKRLSKRILADEEI